MVLYRACTLCVILSVTAMFLIHMFVKLFCENVTIVELVKGSQYHFNEVIAIYRQRV